MTARGADRADLRWIDDLLTPAAIVAAVGGLLGVGFDVRTAHFGGGGILHTIGFWFVVGVVCIERYTLTVVDPMRRGTYQLLLWAAVISSCVRFEILMANDAFVLSLVTSIVVLTGVGVFAQRLTASMNRSLAATSVGLDVMDAIYGRVRDRTSGVVLSRVDGQLVEHVDVEALAAEESAAVADDARSRRSLQMWLVMGTVWLALAGILIEVGDSTRRASMLVNGAQFAVATPMLLALASMRSRREQVLRRGGHAPSYHVRRRLGSAVVVLAVAFASAALTVPLVVPADTHPARGIEGAGDPSSSTGVLDGRDPAHAQGVSAEPEHSSRVSGRDVARSERAKAANGGCASPSNGLYVVARFVVAIMLVYLIYRVVTRRRPVEATAHSPRATSRPRRTIEDWLVEVERSPLDAVPATAWTAIRDAACARGLDGASELAPRELVAALTADRPPWAADLGAAARIYERTVFGAAPIDPSARAEWLVLLSRLLPAICTSGPVPGLDKRGRTA